MFVSVVVMVFIINYCEGNEVTGLQKVETEHSFAPATKVDLFVERSDVTDTTTTAAESKIINLVVTKPETDEAELNEETKAKTIKLYNFITTEVNIKDKNNVSSTEHLLEDETKRIDVIEKITKQDQFMKDVGTIAKLLNTVVKDKIEEEDLIDDNLESNLKNYRRSNSPHIPNDSRYDEKPNVVFLYPPILYCFTPQDHTRLCENYAKRITPHPYFSELSAIKTGVGPHHNPDQRLFFEVPIPLKRKNERPRDSRKPSVSNNACATGEMKYPMVYKTIRC